MLVSLRTQLSPGLGLRDERLNVAGSLQSVRGSMSFLAARCVFLPLHFVHDVEQVHAVAQLGKRVWGYRVDVERGDLIFWVEPVVVFFSQGMTTDRDIEQRETTTLSTKRGRQGRREGLLPPPPHPQHSVPIRAGKPRGHPRPLGPWKAH